VSHCGGAEGLEDLTMQYPTRNKKLIEWVELVAKVTTPIVSTGATGSTRIRRTLPTARRSGAFRRLNPVKRPNSYYALSTE